MPVEIKEIVIRAEITNADTNTPSATNTPHSAENLFDQDSIEIIRNICQQELEKHERIRKSHHRSNKFVR